MEVRMLGRDYQDVEAESVGDGITIRWAIGRDEGAPNFALRVIEFAPGVVFPSHEHPYEHEIFVLEGKGVVEGPQTTVAMRPGVVIYVPPDEVHGYRNCGDSPLRFVCVIPHRPG
jgi:quercetin dioxygenase-like cupin family protein